MATGNRDTEGKGPKRGGGGERQGGRRKRTVYSKEQVDILIKAFKSHPYPSFCMREKLARMMGLQESRLHVWFQNRRARQPKKPSGTTDANKCQNLPAPNFCPPGQPPEMQSSATVAAPNPAVSTSSLPGRNWHLDSHSMQYWESQEASFQYQSSSFGTNSTVHVSQSNFGRDVVNRGMPPGLEGAATLPTVPQPGQGTFCRNAQSDMNYLNPAQPLLRPLGNLQLGEQICAPYFQCSGSAPNLCGMADAMSHFNCIQTIVKEGNVHTQAFPSPSVQWQEAAQEETYPFRVYECPLQETTQYDANWLGTENELLRSSLGLVLENDQTQQQSEGADSSFPLPFSTETFT